MIQILKGIAYATAALYAAGCASGDTDPTGPAPRGSVETRIDIERIGGGLAKRTDIKLERVWIELSAPGETSRVDSFALAGSGAQSVNRTFADMKVREWKARAWTRDKTGAVIHADSTTVMVEENDTVAITLELAARYSMLSASFAPLSDSAARCELWINGSMAADSSFGQKSGLAQVRLNYDYLAASPEPGTQSSIDMKIFGTWAGESTLLWSGSGTITAVSGKDITRTINLAWVGPQVGGAALTVLIGPVATITVEGAVQPRPNTTP